jgi:hypothetical protein
LVTYQNQFVPLGRCDWGKSRRSDREKSTWKGRSDMVSTLFLLLPQKERVTTIQQKGGWDPSHPPPPPMSHVTEPRDRRSGAYVTAQTVAICRTSKLLSIDFSNSRRITSDLRIRRGLFLEHYKWGISTVSCRACAVPHFTLRKWWVTRRSPTSSVLWKGKGKAIPLQAWTGSEGYRRLRLPDFKTIGTWRW